MAPISPHCGSRNSDRLPRLLGLAKCVWGSCRESGACRALALGAAVAALFVEATALGVSQLWGWHFAPRSVTSPRVEAVTSADVDPPLPEGDGRRRLPQYRPLQPASWTEHVLWVPRVLLAPLYVASDLVSRPLIVLGTIAEKNHWRVRVHDFLTFGAANQVGVFPTGRIDTGFRPSVGVYIFWNDVWHASDLRARAATGGFDWWTADARWRIPFGPQTLALAFGFSKRPDSAFYGLGGDSLPEAVRFHEQRFETRLIYSLQLTRRLALTTLVRHTSVAFDPNVAEGTGTSMAEAIAEGRFTAPPALDGGVLALGTGLILELDTREGRFTASPNRAAHYALTRGTGLAAAGYVEQHVGLEKTRADAAEEPRFPAWLSYGGRVVGTLDLTGTQRRVDLVLYAGFTEPLRGAGEVPFTEQVSLGGARPLRGFGSRRLIDRSAAVGTLRYRWPVWNDFDGMLHYAVGNVFGPDLRGFAVSQLRASFGAGIVTATRSDQLFEILLAFGTETFDAGGAVETTRLAIGTSVNF